MVQKTLNNIGFDIPRNVTTKIGGDKGYVTKKRFRLNNGKRSPIITRKRIKLKRFKAIKKNTWEKGIQLKIQSHLSKNTAE